MVKAVTNKRTLDGIKLSVAACLGKKVVLRTNKGKRKAEEREGVLEKVFPCVFTVRVDEGQTSERTVSYSYSDILTDSVEVTLSGMTKPITYS